MSEAKLYKTISAELLDQITCGMEDEGDYYFAEYAQSDMEGTELEPLLKKYLKAKAALENRIQELDEEIINDY